MGGSLIDSFFAKCKNSKTMNAPVCWTLFILNLALCLGCGNPAQQKAFNLHGEWTLQSLTVDGREVSGIKQAAITLVCDGARLHGSGACNSYEARYESPQTGEIKVTQQSWAEMACLDEAQRPIDDAYVQALWKARQVQLNEDELVISDATGNHRLVFIPTTGSASVGLEKTS